MSLSRKGLIAIIALYIFGLFVHLGRMYFQHEEPRRAIIALEMNYNHNYAEPTVLGKPYFKKPPLHNAVIALFFRIFGPNEFSARLVSALSLLLFGVAIFIFARGVLDLESSVVASFSFLVSFVTYFSYGILAETDMFFSLLVFLSMISIFIFRYGVIIGGIFAAFALLTKGFPALHYYYFTLLGFALMGKRFKDVAFIRDAVIASFIIFGLFSAWLALVSHGNIHRFNYVMGFLIHESGGRVLSLEHPLRIIAHSLRFPISFFLHFLPFCLVLLILLNRRHREGLFGFVRSDDRLKGLIRFMSVAFLPNFAVYAIIPDGRIRYTLPLFGFFGVFIGIVFSYIKQIEMDKNKFRRLFEAVFALLFVISLIGALIVFNFTRTHDYYICAFAAFVCLFFGRYVLSETMNAPERLFVGLVSSAIVLKLLFVSIYGSYLYTYYTDYRAYGRKIAGILLKNHPDYVMSDGGNLRLFFYLEKDLGFQIHPVNKRKGWVVSRHKERVPDVKYRVDTPRGVYYIGVKKGG